MRLGLVCIGGIWGIRHMYMVLRLLSHLGLIINMKTRLVYCIFYVL